MRWGTSLQSRWWIWRFFQPCHWEIGYRVEKMFDEFLLPCWNLTVFLSRDNKQLNLNARPRWCWFFRSVIHNISQKMCSGRRSRKRKSHVREMGSSGGDWWWRQVNGRRRRWMRLNEVRMLKERKKKFGSSVWNASKNVKDGPLVILLRSLIDHGLKLLQYDPTRL